MMYTLSKPDSGRQIALVSVEDGKPVQVAINAPNFAAACCEICYQFGALAAIQLGDAIARIGDVKPGLRAHMDVQQVARKLSKYGIRFDKVQAEGGKITKIVDSSDVMDAEPVDDAEDVEAETAEIVE